MSEKFERLGQALSRLDVALHEIIPDLRLKTDSRLRSEALLKFEGYNDVQITTLFLNWLPTVT